MKNKVKSAILGGLLGVVLTTSVGAATINVSGALYTKNPIYSAPKGYASTFGYGKVKAHCSVAKKGYTTKSKSAYYNFGAKHCGSVSTDWISGPTWESKGTKFTSKHEGNNVYGAYETLTASKKF